jgi:glycosyltransferase involved in cell wall biosynthesis
VEIAMALEEFDEIAYFEVNPDVEAAVLSGSLSSGYEHWINHGQKEGRLRTRPICPAEVPEGWSEMRYLRANPDVWAAVRAGSFGSGYEHWSTYGQEEDRPGSHVNGRKAAPAEVLDSIPMGFNCFGFRSAPTGLGSGLRGYLDALLRVTANIAVTDVPVWGMDPPPDRRFDPDRNPFAFNIIHQNPNILGVFLTHYGRKTLNDRINIGCWIWELHAGYPAWRHFSRLFHEIWVPSNYVAESLRSICETSMSVVPFPVNALPTCLSITRSDLGLPGNAFTFTYIFDLASSLARKNPLALLRAFRDAFGSRRDVCLVLKYHNVSSDPTAAATIERLASAYPNVHTFSYTMPGDHVHSLLQISDCFVSPHRSEGFGLNIASAMYYGKPVIVTGYSGNMDFTNDNTSFLIDYDMVAVGPGVPHYREGYGWAEPSVEHLTSLLLRVLENPDLSRKVALAGQAVIREQYSISAIAELIRNRVQALSSPR